MSVPTQYFIPSENVRLQAVNDTAYRQDNGFHQYALIAGSANVFQARFAVPRSAESNKGAQVSSLATVYRLVSGTLASVNVSLTRYTYTDGGVEQSATIAIGAASPAFDLTADATNAVRAVNAVTTPEYENGANTTSSQLVFELTFTTDTACVLDMFGGDVAYDQDTSSVASGIAEETASFTASADNSGMNHPIDSSGGAVTATLPNVTAIGVTLRFTATAATTNDIAISPDATDSIQGLNLNAGATVDKDYILSDPQPGDYIELVSDGTDTWRVTAAAGTWTREA